MEDVTAYGYPADQLITHVQDTLVVNMLNLEILDSWFLM